MKKFKDNTPLTTAHKDSIGGIYRDEAKARRNKYFTPKVQANLLFYASKHSCTPILENESM